MRGVGEPYYELELGLGTDPVGTIMAGPNPAKRMEFELYSKLHDLADGGMAV